MFRFQMQFLIDRWLEFDNFKDFTLLEVSESSKNSQNQKWS